MKDVKTIKKIINENIEDLKSAYNVERLGVFGSYARGEFREDSDVDILVEFSEPVGFFRFIELEDELSDLLGCEVDLVSKNSLKSGIRENALRDLTYV